MACSISASAHTIAGDFPPSSRDTLLIVEAPAAAMCAPVGTLPVKATLATSIN